MKTIKEKLIRARESLMVIIQIKPENEEQRKAIEEAKELLNKIDKMLNETSLIGFTEWSYN